ncbi:putative ribonuclease H-like domain-containing protein [Tanacetum coccineum]
MNAVLIPQPDFHKDHPKDLDQYPSWVEAMQEELLQFRLQKVWTLVDLPNGKRAIRTKWVFKNKKDERGIVVRNKARLVAQGYTQEEGIYYDEFLTHVANDERNHVKRSVSYQPHSFKDSQFPDKVYKVEKALYGLHQAPRAWYETFSTYLLANRFRIGTNDKTLFIKKEKDDAQEILDEFYMGAHFFLCMQVKPKDDGIFISQDKYVADILKKMDFSSIKTASTPIETNKALLKDKEAEDVDVHLYRSMIGSLMYLTTSRPDIMFTVASHPQKTNNLGEDDIVVRAANTATSLDASIKSEVYELKRREKGKHVEVFRSTPFPTPIRTPRTHDAHVSSDTEKLQELTVIDTQTTTSSRSQHTKLSKANRLLSLFKSKPSRFKRYKNFFQELQGWYTYLFEHLKQRFLSRNSFDNLADHLQEVMVESFPIMVDTHILEKREK